MWCLHWPMFAVGESWCGNKNLIPVCHYAAEGHILPWMQLSWCLFRWLAAVCLLNISLIFRRKMLSHPMPHAHTIALSFVLSLAHIPASDFQLAYIYIELGKLDMLQIMRRVAGFSVGCYRRPIVRSRCDAFNGHGIFGVNPLEMILRHVISHQLMQMQADQMSIYFAFCSGIFIKNPY